MSDISTRSRFAILGAEAESAAYATLAADVEVAAGSVALGIGPDGLSRLLIPVAADAVIIEDRSGAAVQIRRHTLLEGDSAGTFLEVVCLRTDLIDAFSLLVDDVLRRLADGEAPITAAKSVLDSWRDLLADAGSSELSDQRLAGFLGELLTFLGVLRSVDDPSIDMWTGPIGGIHDVVAPGFHLEIKTTTSSQRWLARIHGLAQLETLDGDTELFLGAVRLVPDPDGSVSLGSLIRQAAEVGIGTVEIYARAAAAGIDAGALARSDRREFRHVESLFFQVAGDFPRLTNRDLVSGLPVGVSDVQYTVDLSGREPVASSPEQLLLLRADPETAR